MPPSTGWHAAATSASPRDSRRRLLQMFGEVVRGVPAQLFEDSLTEPRRPCRSGHRRRAPRGVPCATSSTASLAAYRSTTGEHFPEDPRDRALLAVRAVFDSWSNERAATYRQLNGIPDDLGTAVTVQRMVFGNLGESSGAGVAFSRDPTDRGTQAPTATSCSTRRARTSSPGSATPRPSTGSPPGCPASMRS